MRPPDTDPTGGLGWQAPIATGLLAMLLDGRKVVRVGRSSRCDLVLRDDAVSRHHVMLRREPDRIVLTDLGSTNGTWSTGVTSPRSRCTPATA